MKKTRIQIGEETYKLILETGRYHDSILSICQIYSILYGTVRGYMNLYRNRVVSPKPSTSEEELFKRIRLNDKYNYRTVVNPDYTFLDDIIGALLRANNSNDIETIIKKYDVVTVKKVILEYIAGADASVELEDKKKLTDAIDIIDELTKRKEKGIGPIGESRIRIKELIERYLNSSDIFLDRIFFDFYSINNSVSHIMPTLESFAKDSPENMALYTSFLKTKEERLARLTSGLKKLLDSVPISAITSLDIELASGMSIKKLGNIILKKEIVDALGRKSVDFINRKIKSELVHYRIYSKEDAKSIVLVYRGKKMDESDLDEIWRFLLDNNIEPTYANIVYAFRKMFLSIEEEIGKKAYERYILGNGASYWDLIKEYNIDTETIKKYITKYRKRLINPRPTEKEESKYRLLERGLSDNYSNLNNLINDLINASNDDDLLKIVNKYKLVAIRNAVREYLISCDDPVISKKISLALSKIMQMRVNNSAVPSSKITLRDLIYEYIESGDVYPDFIVTRNGKDIKLFNHSINHPESTADDFKRDIEYFKKVKEDRIQRFILLAEELSNLMEKKVLNVLDAQLISKMSIKELCLYLGKTEVLSALGRKNSMELISFIRKGAGNMRKYSKEEALMIKYTYNGRMMTAEDINKIFTFLNDNNLDVTYSNIILTFNKMVKGEIVISSNLNKN